MVISDLIAEIITIYGKEILFNKKFINILSDYQAFQEIPSARNVLKGLMDNGELKEIYDNYEPSDNKVIYLAKKIQHLFNYYGIRYDIVESLIVGITKGIDRYRKKLNKGKHLIIKNILINGNVQDFVDRMTMTGCRLEKPFDNNGFFAIMKGNFLGEENCEFYICATSSSNTVHNVQVRIPIHLKVWNEIYYIYRRCKEMIISQYGKPQYEKEMFYYPFSEGDGQEISALINRHIRFETIVEAVYGDITIEILPDYILVMYDDKKNSLRSFNEGLFEK